MGVETALIVGMGAMTAATQIQAGRKQAQAVQKQGEFNAQVYEQQGQMVLQQQKIKNDQYLRQKRKMEGTMIAGTAGKGFDLSGSPLAVMIDNETQLGFDNSISNYNSEVQKNYATSGANYYRETGKQQSSLAQTQGYSNAFSTILNTGFMAGRL